MTEPKAPENERELGELLKSEAMRTRPEFSPQLHRRFFDAVKESTLGSRANLPQPIRNGRNLGLRLLRATLATAAACLIVASAGVLWWNRSAPLDMPAAAPNPLAAFTDAAGHASHDAAQAADSALAANQWSRIDEDAKTAAKMLLENLPLDMLVKNHNTPH